MNDFWTRSSFIEAVTRAATTLYERDFRPDCFGDAFDKTTPSTIARMRKNGVFIPAPDRLVWGCDIDGVDGIPQEGCISIGESPLGAGLGDYCRILYFVKKQKLPRRLRCQWPGQRYEMAQYWAQPVGPSLLQNWYFILDRQGRPHLAAGGASLNDEARELKLRLEETFVGALQFCADRRHQWTITAANSVSHVSVGAYPEAVKSLLYARSLPLSDSGRKRPILHLVAAHHRRVSVGIDIDIDPFLRGTREVEMDGIRYSVQAPQALISALAATRTRR